MNTPAAFIAIVLIAFLFMVTYLIETRTHRIIKRLDRIIQNQNNIGTLTGEFIDIMKKDVETMIGELLTAVNEEKKQ